MNWSNLGLMPFLVLNRITLFIKQQIIIILVVFRWMHGQVYGWITDKVIPMWFFASLVPQKCGTEIGSSILIKRWNVYFLPIEQSLLQTFLHVLVHFMASPILTIEVSTRHTETNTRRCRIVFNNCDCQKEEFDTFKFFITSNQAQYGCLDEW